MIYRAFLLIVIVSMYALDGFSQTEAYNYQIDRVTGISLNSNHEVELAAQVNYPNGCFLPFELAGNVNRHNGAIELSHRVQIQNKNCIQAVVSRSLIVNLGPLESGTYQVSDQHTKKFFGVLYVDQRGIFFEPNDFIHEIPVMKE